MSEPREFALQIGRFAELAKNRADLVVRKVLLDIGSRLVMRSPVGDPAIWKHTAPAGYIGGHFRANWQYAEGFIPGGVFPSIDKTGQVSLDRMKSKVPQSPYGKVHFIVNNLPYGPRLETGWSRQAPGGMVGLVVREYQMIVAKALREAKQTR